MTITPDTLLDSAAVADCLSTRALNVLDGINATRETHTVRDLAGWRTSKLLEVRGCGERTLQELTGLIRRAGLEWGRPTDEQPKAAPPEPKPTLPKVVQLTTAGDYLYALLDDGTIWWTATVGRSWSYMVPPPPCTSPDKAVVLAARLQAIRDFGRRQFREAITPSQPMSPDNTPA